MHYIILEYLNLSLEDEVSFMRRFFGIVLTLGGSGFVYWQNKIVQDGMRGYIDSRVSAGAYQYLGINPNSVAAHHQERIDTAEGLIVAGVIVAIIGIIMVLIPKRKSVDPIVSGSENGS
jgi:hypothetical protein